MMLRAVQFLGIEVNVTSTETGEQIDGYCFDEDQDVLWFEGTGQVSVMHWVAGDRVGGSCS